jgi:hypothetical protein
VIKKCKGKEDKLAAFMDRKYEGDSALSSLGTNRKVRSNDRNGATKV